jgi:hypothetical protein
MTEMSFSSNCHFNRKTLSSVVIAVTTQPALVVTPTHFILAITITKQFIMTRQHETAQQTNFNLTPSSTSLAPPPSPTGNKQAYRLDTGSKGRG